MTVLPSPSPNTIQLPAISAPKPCTAGTFQLYFDLDSGLIVAIDSEGNSVFPDGPATPPGGANTQVQINDNGAFGASADFTYDLGTKAFLAGEAASGNTVRVAPASGTASLASQTNTAVTGQADVNIDAAADLNLQPSNGNFGIFGATAVPKQDVTGSKGANAALTSLIAALVAYGFITDSTT